MAIHDSSYSLRSEGDRDEYSRLIANENRRRPNAERRFRYIFFAGLLILSLLVISMVVISRRVYLDSSSLRFHEKGENTFKNTTKRDCDETDPPCEIELFGLCYKHGKCTDSHSSFPTIKPTSRPSETLNCDPKHPPCDVEMFGLCYHRRKCDDNNMNSTLAPSSHPTKKS
jgi:hypothetical protein